MSTEFALYRQSVVGALLLVGLIAGGVLSQSEKAAKKSDPAQIERGRYLVTYGGCNDCHTPKKFTEKGPEPDMTRELSGTPPETKIAPIPEGILSPTGWGAMCTPDLTAWAGPWGVSFAINLTPDPETGMGRWTESAFVQAMRTGKHKGVLRDILPPMPWFSVGALTDDDIKAVFAYLQSIKPIVNKVPDPIPPTGK